LRGPAVFFADSEKKPQVFRNPGGSPALQKRKTYPLQPAIAQAIFSLLLTERLHLFFQGLRRG
jgi:hypothetical protein